MTKNFEKLKMKTLLIMALFFIFVLGSCGGWQSSAVTDEKGSDMVADDGLRALEIGEEAVEEQESKVPDEQGSEEAEEDEQKGVDALIEPTMGANLVPDIDPEGMILIPEGQFWMGCDESNATLCYEWELPLHQVWLPAYWVDIYEVTNTQYRECVAAGVCSEPWKEGAARLYDPAYDGHPVNGVDWNQAAAFCQYVGKRLLTEAEWEKAARGVDRTDQYPWDENEISCQRANYYQGGHLKPEGYCISPPEGDTTPVGFYNGENWFTNDRGEFQTIDSPSPFGLYDVIGNAAEWVSGSIPAYPWPADTSSGLFGRKELARGGAYSIYEHLCDVHCRGLIYERAPKPGDEKYLDDLHFFGIRCGMDDSAEMGVD